MVTPGSGGGSRKRTTRHLAEALPQPTRLRLTKDLRIAPTREQRKPRRDARCVRRPKPPRAPAGQNARRDGVAAPALRPILGGRLSLRQGTLRARVRGRGTPAPPRLGRPGRERRACRLVSTEPPGRSGVPSLRGARLQAPAGRLDTLTRSASSRPQCLRLCEPHKSAHSSPSRTRRRAGVRQPRDAAPRDRRHRDPGCDRCLRVDRVVADRFAGPSQPVQHPVGPQLSSS